MHGSMRRREAITASRASTRRAAAEASRRPYILDVFSRYIVGWTVQYRENAQLATALIEQAAEQQQITPKILTLHADRGAPQRAAARQAGRVPARRPRHHENTLAPVHLQRQPLLGVELQDPEISTRIPRPVRRHRPRSRSLPRVRRLVQPRPPPLRDRAHDPGRRPPRHRGGAAPAARSGARRRLRTASRAVRP